MTYHSKTDLRTTLIFWIAIVLSTVAAILEIATGRSLAIGLGLLFMELVLLRVVFPLTYEITEEKLLVRSGYRRWAIPLSDIVSVKPAVNTAQAPAWSQFRLLVVFRKEDKFVALMISPKEEEQFLRELASREPALQRHGQGLARAGIAAGA